MAYQGMTHLPLAEPVLLPLETAVEHQRTSVDHCQESEACVHLKSLESEVCLHVKLGLNRGTGVSSLDLEVSYLEMEESGHESEDLAAEEVLKPLIEV